MTRTEVNEPRIIPPIERVQMRYVRLMVGEPVMGSVCVSSGIRIVILSGVILTGAVLAGVVCDDVSIGGVGVTVCTRWS